MFKSIREFFYKKMFGELVCSYDRFKVKHGAWTFKNRFELRQKNGVFQLLHERVSGDGHSLKKSYPIYSQADVEALSETMIQALEFIRQGESHDFGQILEEQNGSMVSKDFFYVEPSGGEHYLFCRHESKARGSSSTRVHYYPEEEIVRIAEVLIDAIGHMQPAAVESTT